MAGLTANGFERKRLEDIVADIETALQATFGNDIDLRPESVFGQLVGVLADPIAELWEEAENAYLSKDPDAAEGTQLDVVAALTGIVRLQSAPTVVTATLIGDQGTVVSAESLASSVAGDSFTLLTSTTITNAAATYAEITVATVANATAYTITINGTDRSYTSDADATEAEIIAGLSAAVFGDVTVAVVGTTLQISATDGQTAFSLAVSGDLTTASVGSPAQFQAVTFGAVSVGIGELNSITTPVSGWSSITNLISGDIGRSVETDTELRERRAASVAATAQATVDALTANISRLTGVDSVLVLENTTNATDADGTPAHTIWATVQGGVDAEIANAIYQRKAAGIGTRGDQNIEVTGTNGQVRTINFDRPADVPIYVEIELEVDAAFPSDGADLIKTALVAYGVSSFIIGGEVQYSRLFTPINSVPGHEVLALRIGTAPSPTGTTSVSIPAGSLASLATSNISVTIP